MSKFTKGEWVYDDFSAIVETVSNNSRPICIVMEDSENDYSEEEDANGRLIAAAPKMYALLKVWTQVGAEPMLRNARKRAEELLARIDNEEATHEGSK